jgi:hypothetical protein
VPGTLGRDTRAGREAPHPQLDGARRRRPLFRGGARGERLGPGRDTSFHRENPGEFGDCADLSADRRGEPRDLDTKRDGTELHGTGRDGTGGDRDIKAGWGRDWDGIGWDGTRDPTGRWAGMESAGTAAPNRR